MEISSLHAFIAVAKHASFSRAAEALHLTQPAISKRIASLEGELHCRLFDRVGRVISLTEAGHTLLPGAKKIIDEVEHSRQMLSNLAGKVSGRLSIGTSHHIGLHRLPPVLRRFTNDYPEVELDLHFLDSEEICQAVAQGKFEVGVVTLPSESSTDSQLRAITLWPDPLVCMVDSQHPLRTETGPVALRKLIRYPAILPNHGTYTRELLDEILKPVANWLHITLETNYLETIKTMVEVGLGWSILPQSMQSRDLYPVQLKGVNLSRQLGYVQHRQRTHSNAARAFVDALEHCASV